MSNPSKSISSEVPVGRTSFHTMEAGGVRVFYREAGPVDAPVLLLLRGFPSSSRMLRELIPHIATVEFLDTGHFALETHVDEIAAAMHRLLARAAA